MAAQRYEVGYGAPITTQPGATTVILNTVNQTRALRDWSSGLCSCFDDCGICMLVTFCSGTGIAGCIMSNEMGENCCIPCCVPGWIVALRTKLRTQLNIQGSICDDCVISTFCGPCVHCQMWREYRNARATAQL